MSEIEAFHKSRPDIFPATVALKTFQCIEPERIPALTQAMLDHQYSREAIAKILGGNYLRVAQAVWK